MKNNIMNKLFTNDDTLYSDKEILDAKKEYRKSYFNEGMDILNETDLFKQFIMREVIMENNPQRKDEK